MNEEQGPTRVGVFGGMFDPLHLGHLAAAQDASEVLALDQVLFVPARQPPHRRTAPTAPAEARLRMVAAAVEEDARFQVSDVEVRRDGPSYTIDTLRTLRGTSDAELVLILGSDQWATFDTWREPAEIAGLAELAVLAREGTAPGDVAPPFPRETVPSFVEVPLTRIDVSSTQVRERIACGRSIRYLVPEPVRRIIIAENLYL